VKRIAMKAAAALAVSLLAFPAVAEEAVLCLSRVTRTNVVRCALTASLVVKAQRHELDAAEGRKRATSPLLPSNPVITVSVARRRAAAGVDATNWYATLAQEIEIGGQRGARRDAATALEVAQSKRVVASTREVAAAAWLTYFEVVAAREEDELAGRLAAAARAVSIVARARAENGLIAPVDADVAEASAIRVFREKLAAGQRLASATVSLMSLIGLDPMGNPITIDGELAPLPGVETAAKVLGPLAPADRSEVQALEAQRRAEELRASAWRRTRVPNPTLSVFAQNDGLNERVLGLGISFPIPLPGNVGRSYIGEVAEAEARARRAAAERDLQRREVRLEIAVAARAFEFRRDDVAVFTPALLKRTEESLRALAQEVEAGRLGIRDAVLAQQALVQLLQGNVEARRWWCLASVDLARAIGMPLDAVTP